MRYLLRHFFIPHHANNHRPHALHHKTLSLIIVLFLGLAFLLPPLRHNYPSVLGISYNISTKDLLDLTNKKRTEAGLKTLVLDERLSKAAEDKAQYMLEKNFWAHVAPDGTTPWYFIKNSGYEYQYAGENLARGFSTASEVVDAWMESPTHRENMLSRNYSDVGFAVVSGTLTGSDTVLVVEEFGSKYNPNGDSSEQTAKSGGHKFPITTSTDEQSSEVAALTNKPLLDSKSTSRNIAIGVLIVFIIILILDLIMIERKKITRRVSHNLDHVIFLTILLLAAIIIGAGSIL